MVITILTVLAGALIAGPDEKPTEIDTLIIEPAESRDLPKSVVTWLEARDYLIPQANEQWKNVISGSFTDVNQTDFAVITVKRSAMDDSCSLWIFPAGDTLTPMLLGPYKVNFYAGTNWWPPYGQKTPLGYAWYIVPISQEWIVSLKQYATDQSEFPDVSHQGIYLSIVDKGVGWQYYYDGYKWLRLNGAD